MHDKERLNLTRPKSISECVHFSYSCSEVAETTFTVPVEINNIRGDQSMCSSRPPSSSTRETGHDPVENEAPQVETPEEIVVRIDAPEDCEALGHSDLSDCTPTEDLFYYTDCQALITTSSATEEEIFYSQLEEMSLSTISVAEELPSDSAEANQSTFCCDVFTPVAKEEETNSVLEEELEEDDAEGAPTSHVQNHFSDCFPI